MHKARTLTRSGATGTGFSRKTILKSPAGWLPLQMVNVRDPAPMKPAPIRLKVFECRPPSPVARQRCLGGPIAAKAEIQHNALRLHHLARVRATSGDVTLLRSRVAGRGGPARRRTRRLRAHTFDPELRAMSPIPPCSIRCGWKRGGLRAPSHPSQPPSHPKPPPDMRAYMWPMRKQNRRLHRRPQPRKSEGRANMSNSMKNNVPFSICACHPCAPATLISSVSLQFYRMNIQTRAAPCACLCSQRPARRQEVDGASNEAEALW